MAEEVKPETAAVDEDVKPEAAAEDVEKKEEDEIVAHPIQAIEEPEMEYFPPPDHFRDSITFVLYHNKDKGFYDNNYPHTKVIKYRKEGDPAEEDVKEAENQAESELKAEDQSAEGRPAEEATQQD